MVRINHIVELLADRDVI